MSSSSASDSESAAGRSAAMRPSGPGAGVIDLQFGKLKAGGFKVFLLFFLLGVSAENSRVYQVEKAFLC